MRWTLTLYGGESHKKTLIIEGDTIEEAKRMALLEMKKTGARVFELEKVE